MSIPEFQHLLAKDLYCHIKNFEDLISFNYDEAIQFKNFWNSLKLDQNFKDYTHRERRILRYIYQSGKELEIDYNNEYNSSVTYDNIKYKQGANQLTYVEDDFINNALMQKILATDIKILDSLLDKKVKYMINIHLFRVAANNGNISPTTSGIHKDGMNLICMHYIDSQNIHPVISKLYTDDSPNSEIVSLTMNKFLEALIVDDQCIFHSASEVRQLNLNQLACRDLLLVTFKQI